MRVGVVFPQTEIGTDVGVIQDYAQTAEQLGFCHLLAYDHVIGGNLGSRPGWQPPYSHLDAFHEPLVLFAYLAGQTSKLEFVTGVIILPQRQTVLVAKQTAALDVLSGGRLRVGIGLGWNSIEYEALGENFHNRGRRSEEQVEVLRDGAASLYGSDAIAGVINVQLKKGIGGRAQATYGKYITEMEDVGQVASVSLTTAAFSTDASPARRSSTTPEEARRC